MYILYFSIILMYFIFTIQTNILYMNIHLKDKHFFFYCKGCSTIYGIEMIIGHFLNLLCQSLWVQQIDTVNFILLINI